MTKILSRKHGDPFKDGQKARVIKTHFDSEREAEGRIGFIVNSFDDSMPIITSNDEPSFYVYAEEWELVGYDAETGIEVNAKGGKQSKLDTRYDLVPFSAIHEAATILKTGADKYGVDNWRKIPTESHINHALEHLYRHLEHKRLNTVGIDYELGHAMVRLMFAVAVEIDGEAE